MTLILTYLNQSHVVQVSDRRIRWEVRPGRYLQHEEQRNKAIVWCNRMVFGFSGIAEINGERADEWIAEQLAGPERLWDAVQQLKSAAEAAFSRRPLKSRPLYISGSGWKRTEEGLVPFSLLLANTIEGRNWVDPPLSRFQLDHVTVRAASLNAIPFNVISDAVAEAVMRDANSAAEHGSSVRSAIRILAQAVRNAADDPRFRERIGHSLMTASLPKAAVPPDDKSAMLLMGHSQPGTATFAYMPEDSSVEVAYGPILVGPFGVISDFKIETPPP